MIQATLKIDILSYWHAGTGHGQGAAYDALTQKDATGLPFLPGRTVKGLLREGVQLAEDFGSGSESSSSRWPVAALFGKPAREWAPDGSEPGMLMFSDAHLPDGIRRWVAGDPDMAQTLFRALSATALDDAGQAKDHTLRTIEVCVPSVLEATVSCVLEDAAWIPVLQGGARLVRALGSHRNRGLGRCVVTLTAEGVR